MSESQTPVWLQQKITPSRLNLETKPDLKENRLSHKGLIEGTKLALDGHIDENFDYKDFNFIVGKTKSAVAAHHAKHSAANRAVNNYSPSLMKNLRYQHAQHKAKSMSENYHMAS